MIKIKELKTKAKQAFYRNWKTCVAICFIYAILVGASIISINKEFDFDYRDNLKVVNLNNISKETNSEIVNEFVTGITGIQPIEHEFITNATRGVFGTILNNITSSGSYLFGFLNAVNQVLFNDRIWASVIIIIGTICLLFYWIFVSKVLEVGLARFFLENRKYTKTKVSRLATIFKLGKTTHIAYTMFIKNIKILLWAITIIGPLIKHYSYMLVPYILAENPNLKTKDVLKLSEEMMHGYKWKCFKLDLSFIGWYLLGFITFNISNIVFTTPYLNATKAEVYMKLRDLSKTKGINNSNLLKDYNLEGDIVEKEYPLYDSMLKSTKKSRSLNFNYQRNYGLVNLILLFFIFSCVGWIYEVLLTLFEHGIFVNRGTLYGPWLPIYGSGAVAILVFLKKYRSNFFLYFFLTMLCCGVLEYIVGVYLETMYNMAWWDYHGYFLNLNGRVCLEGLLLFAVSGVLVTYLAAPFIATYLDKIKKKVKVILCIILVSLIALDFYASSLEPNSGKGISVDIKEKM